MKLTKLEEANMKKRMEGILANDSSPPLQRKLAEYWMDRLNRKGKYAMMGEAK